MKWAIPLLSVLLLVGCSSAGGRQQSVQHLPLDDYPPAIRAALKAGRVNIGFSGEMVRASRGKPDRVYQKRSEQGITDVWSYVAVETNRVLQKVGGRSRLDDPRGYRSSRRNPTWVEVDQKTEYEVMRIEMDDGVVVAVESLAR